MPSNHYSGSDTSRPEMGTMGIMNRARGMQIVENGFHVRMMFLLLGLLLSIVNLPIASGQNDPPPPPNNSQQSPITPSPSASGLDHPPPISSAPLGGGVVPPAPDIIPPPPVFPSPAVGPPPPAGGPPPSTEGPPPPALPPPPAVSSSPAPGESPPSPESGPPPPPPPIGQTGGDTWNESEKAGVVIASIAALLQVAVVAFLLIKRHQMLTTVEYDDIEDLEYDTPPDSNFRDIESA